LKNGCTELGNVQGVITGQKGCVETVCTADDQCGGNQVCDTDSTKCKCADGHHESNGVCVKDGCVENDNCNVENNEVCSTTTNQCECAEGFSRLDVDKKCTADEPPCNPEIDCSNQGSCNDDKTCTCNDGFSGDDCSIADGTPRLMNGPLLNHRTKYKIIPK
jgi:hypothetical protein